ncbi:hypothetical protein IEQ34_001952 [Dendrobium chrysotoxum]|uniref:Uncharacterized protein n=1 Tax=Dendrobium chrysotoxum TaxID=161865 RepID=A0AAV7H3M3_DENCH|nr:hypothetical protein IEQ34_001952 [Dendrobium chrysotoxum]
MWKVIQLRDNNEATFPSEFLFVHHTLQWIGQIDARCTDKKERLNHLCKHMEHSSRYTRVHIDVNENGVQCNIPKSILFGSYLRAIVRDHVLASISLSD